MATLEFSKLYPDINVRNKTHPFKKAVENKLKHNLINKISFIHLQF
jgi:hypothetical protein